ncbi:hypothetical protein RZS08_63175, partial [Arthrospira platensis SPKY1]|nr:hypothetical protein [Arthrospira platensis SPKY1]
MPGSILITERVIHDLRSHPQFSPVSLGKFEFKNVNEPMEIFAMADTGIVVPQEKDLAVRPKVQPVQAGGRSTRWLPWLTASALLLALLAFAFH